MFFPLTILCKEWKSCSSAPHCVSLHSPWRAIATMVERGMCETVADSAQ